MSFSCSKPCNALLLHLEPTSQVPHHGQLSPTWLGPHLLSDLLSPPLPRSLGSCNTSSLLFPKLPRPALSLALVMHALCLESWLHFFPWFVPSPLSRSSEMSLPQRISLSILTKTQPRPSLSTLLTDVQIYLSSCFTTQPCICLLLFLVDYFLCH